MKQGVGDKKIRPDTVIELLNTAEMLFASKGFYAVSIRDITKEANVSLSAINYHFGSKDELFIAVISRRADALSERRRELLEEAMQEPSENSDHLEAIISAFIKPILEKASTGDKGWRNYLRLIAHVAQSGGFAQDIMISKYNPTAKIFIDAMQQELPNVSHEDVILGFMFLMGTLLHIFAETGRLESLSDGNQHSDNYEYICHQMLPFLTAGLRGLHSKK